MTTGADPATLDVTTASPADAADVVAVIHAAFGSRPALDPPSTALAETTASVAQALAGGGGLVARLAGRPVGALLLHPEGQSLHLRRVSVVPDAQQLGVARALASAAEEVAVREGFARILLLARAELPGTVTFWEKAGFAEVSRDGPHLTMGKELAVEIPVRTAAAMQDLGRRLARSLRAGDVIILAGDLGAGKTTLVQGIGAGLGVRGEVTSPTFVIARVHPALRGGPALVHADAYRLAGLAELDDLDLDVSVEDSVTVVEWGSGVAEALAEDRLEVTIARASGAADPAEERQVRIVPVGARWVGSDLRGLVA